MRNWITLLMLVAMLGTASSDALTLQGQVSQTEAYMPEPALSAQVAQVQEPGIVGMNMEIRQGAMPVVVEVYPATPAQRAGLRPGDQIVAINQLSTSGMTIYQVDAAISDVPGEQVHFLVSRQGYVFQTALTVERISQVHQPRVRALFDGLMPVYPR